MGRMRNAYYERGERVARALMYGQTLTVELDAGVFDLAGDELRDVWDDLAPGEPFTILAVSGDDFPCCTVPMMYCAPAPRELHTGQHMQGCRACYAYIDARGGAR